MLGILSIGAAVIFLFLCIGIGMGIAVAIIEWIAGP